MSPFTLDLAAVEDLYKKYSEDLKRVRRYQTLLYKSIYRPPNLEAIKGTEKLEAIADELMFLLSPKSQTGAQYDEVECELTYMFLREEQPEHVVEFSPCGGWTTTWILNALRDNGHGDLISFDIQDACIQSVPEDLREGIWQFVYGRIQDNLHRLPESIDYLFIDSDHSETFADWYLAEIFPRTKPGAMTSVHDIYHPHGPAFSGGEGPALLRWLANHEVQTWDAARYNTPGNLLALMEHKRRLGLGDAITGWNQNPSVFFRMPNLSEPCMDEPTVGVPACVRRSAAVGDLEARLQIFNQRSFERMESLRRSYPLSMQ